MRLVSQLFLLLSLAATSLDAREYRVYVAEGAELTAPDEQLRALREFDPSASWVQVPLSRRCDSEAQARRALLAIRDGVSILPCVALADDQGCYACLPVEGLSAEHLRAAQQYATAPDRAAKAQRRRFEASRYLLFARLNFRPPTDLPACRLYIQRARQLLEDSCAGTEDRQLIGLRALYPLLMQQYSLLSQGAHTPESEATLLEAIAALEAARDLDPQSALGRQAYDERERLRAARLKSRRYE